MERQREKEGSVGKALYRVRLLVLFGFGWLRKVCRGPVQVECAGRGASVDWKSGYRVRREKRALRGAKRRLSRKRWSTKGGVDEPLSSAGVVLCAASALSVKTDGPAVSDLHFVEARTSVQFSTLSKAGGPAAVTAGHPSEAWNFPRHGAPERLGSLRERAPNRKKGATARNTALH